MGLTVEQRNEAAQLLSDAGHECDPIEPLTARFDGMTLDDAYGVQLANVAVRLVAGDAVTGHKVGLTNATLQEVFGTKSPTYGHLFEDMVLLSGATVRTHDFCQPRAEAEIAFMLGHRLQGPGITVDDVLAAT